MRLNMASDFALRILILLAKSENPLTVDKIASELGLAKSHVMKIVARLGNRSYVKSTRGRVGGVQIEMPLDKIKIGEIVRLMEADFSVVECLKPGHCECNFVNKCALKPVMLQATDAFLAELDKHTLQSVIEKM
ncbi:MAG: RrF2 family transcriptional regulator [Methyloligellaceae bacterium]